MFASLFNAEKEPRPSATKKSTIVAPWPEGKELPRVLVVDDDPTFGKIMEQVAKSNGTPLTYVRSLDELGKLRNWDYDVAVIDYDLGAVTGLELTSYLESFTEREVPVILVSQNNQKPSKDWPESLRRFVHKNVGPFAILSAAFGAAKG